MEDVLSQRPVTAILRSAAFFDAVMARLTCAACREMLHLSATDGGAVAHAMELLETTEMHLNAFFLSHGWEKCESCTRTRPLHRL